MTPRGLCFLTNFNIIIYHNLPLSASLIPAPLCFLSLFSYFSVSLHLRKNNTAFTLHYNHHLPAEKKTSIFTACKLGICIISPTLSLGIITQKILTSVRFITGASSVMLVVPRQSASASPHFDTHLFSSSIQDRLALA